MKYIGEVKDVSEVEESMLLAAKKERRLKLSALGFPRPNLSNTSMALRLTIHQ